MQLLGVFFSRLIIGCTYICAVVHTQLNYLPYDFFKVRDNLHALIDRLINEIPNIRIGLIAQGDYCDYNNYVIKTHDLSGDTESLKQFAMNVPATGGGDAPEVRD